ncbi:TRAP transporter small permease subunit [Wenzhouxiangella sp. XN79A]|uniref:TRAP transporter small permease subunit n=1 Tax=Wenzhouxiangella sp. XN79A TaxID=2724193 RepID=UPI00144ADDCB|nr:TRAP transporter small permease subunit [Wenzhouxiangella sp. XN79A]
MSEGAPEGANGHVPATAFGRWIRHLEVGLLGVLFVALVLLGLTQIGLRNLADSALPWADPAMRAGVLWLAMLSAALAADEARHIRIDLLGRFLPDAARAIVDRIMFAITSLFCIGMVYLSLQTVQLEREFGDLAFLDVPRWLVLAIIPVGFALMGWRFMRRAVLGSPPAAPAAAEVPSA